jgi:transposase-like protein
MATKVTACTKCGSYSVLELNPEVRENSIKPLVGLQCKCKDCNEIFWVQTWTRAGRRRGIRY